MQRLHRVDDRLRGDAELFHDFVARRAQAETVDRDPHRELTRDQAKLRLELATLKSPARLEKLAREVLAMAPPPPGAVLTLGPPAVRQGRSVPPPPADALRPVRYSDRGVAP